MRYPLGLVYDSAKHLLAGKFRRDGKFAVSVSLDPMGGYENTCAETAGERDRELAIAANEVQSARPMLTVEQCLAALDECQAPVVSISGGEPLEYPQIPELTREILARGKHLFLLTDGTLIRRRLHMIPPYTNFFWNVKLDGTADVHDARAGRPGIFGEAMDGVKAAKNAGFFVVITTTVCPDTSVEDAAKLYRELHAMHVDGYILAPGYARKKVCKTESQKFHRQMQLRFRELSDRLGGYNLMMSPVYLEYLCGERELDCCVWGSPVYGPRGWAAPCYLLNEGYAKSFRELTEKTVWENYGRGVNPRCETCMCTSGFESSALLGMNPKAGDTWKMLAWQFGGSLGEKRERAGAR
ncbi:MAG: adenosyl-hopene transferase HpnH [Candidatus Acidiferrum sp.]